MFFGGVGIPPTRNILQDDQAIPNICGFPEYRFIASVQLWRPQETECKYGSVSDENKYVKTGGFSMISP
jgi:hypothetical protein